MARSGKTLEPIREEWLEETGRAMGLKRLNYTWAKVEILAGLAAAAAGLKLLLGDGWIAAAGGALMTLGGYLALAGSRSHLYQSLNRQTAYLLQTLIREEASSKESDRG